MKSTDTELAAALARAGESRPIMQLLDEADDSAFFVDSPNPTTSLMERAKELKEATEEHIEILLAEREALETSTADRQLNITAELKQLGWKPARKPRTKKEKV